jgi:hypothetical protein
MKPNQILDYNPNVHNLDKETLRWYWVRGKYFLIAGCTFLFPSGLVMAIFSPQEATDFFNIASFDTTRFSIIGSFGLGVLFAILAILFFILHQYKKGVFNQQKISE